MQKFIAAIAGLGLILNGPAAKATPQFRLLLSTLQEAGVNLIADDHPACDDPDSFGRYIYNYQGQNDFVVCVDNHNGDDVELLDTVLHESIHVIQACRNGTPIYTQASLVRASTPEQISFVGENYSREQFHQELEARVLAANEDEVSITKLINRYCL